MESKKKQSTENFIKDIRRKTRRLFTSDQKIMIVMEALRGELSTAEICRKLDRPTKHQRKTIENSILINRTTNDPETNKTTRKGIVGCRRCVACQ